MFKFLATIYVIIALTTAGLVLNDYADCYRMRWSSLTPHAMGAGFMSTFSGIIWPLSLPAMIVFRGEKEGLFCIN